MTEPRRMVSSAPWPVELEDLVKRMRCWQGWEFELEDGEHDGGEVTGLRLLIHLQSANSYHPERKRPTTFVFPVPAATYDRRSWEDWLWDRVMDVPRHETGEALAFVYQRPNEAGEMVEVSEHPFAPFHGPGRDPNHNTRVGVDPMEVRVRQDGGRYAGWWWDGETVHDDATHDAVCPGRPPCTPVQLMESPPVSE